MPRSFSDVLRAIAERLVDAKRKTARAVLYDTAVHAIAPPRGEFNAEYPYVRTGFETVFQRIAGCRRRIDGQMLIVW